MTRDIEPESGGVDFGVLQRVNANRTPETQEVADQLDHAARMYDQAIPRLAEAERQLAAAFGCPDDESTRGSLVGPVEQVRAELERARAHWRR
jgi:hypothetical protein